MVEGRDVKGKIPLHNVVYILSCLLDCLHKLSTRLFSREHILETYQMTFSSYDIFILRILQHVHPFACAFFQTYARGEERKEKKEVVRHWWGTGEFNRIREAWPCRTLKREGVSLANLAERHRACFERWALMRPSKLVKPDYAGPRDGRASLKLSRCFNRAFAD
jgi:hypothetical protein